MERLPRTQRARRELLAERLCTVPREGGEGGVLQSEGVRESGSLGLEGAVVETCRTDAEHPVARAGNDSEGAGSESCGSGLRG